MKVFNVSPHRSGTQSFHAFCRAHGILAQHWPGEEFDAAVEPFLPALDTKALFDLSLPYLHSSDSFADLPVPLLCKELVDHFPTAKFVLVLRDPDQWVASVRRHAHGRDFCYLEKFFYWSLGYGEYDRIDDYSDKQLKQGYEGFISDVAWRLSACRVDYRMIDLNNPNLGPALAEFIGFEQHTAFAQIS
jgi:hypothetical protein